MSHQISKDNLIGDLVSSESTLFLSFISDFTDPGCVEAEKILAASGPPKSVKTAKRELSFGKSTSPR